MCGYCGCNQTEKMHHEHQHEHENTRIIQIEKDILAENQSLADQNRIFLQKRCITALNLVSSPGSGKTTLLTKIIPLLTKTHFVSVIEGDQQTSRDAERIATTGVPVLQINTGKACHLDAHRIAHALQNIPLHDEGILFIENVGNLVCPAMFDLGEAAKVVILSVTEGDDKPLKYPHMFDQAQLMVINKIDLLPYVEFDMKKCIEYALRINPQLEVIETSATKEIGLSQFSAWILRRYATH